MPKYILQKIWETPYTSKKEVIKDAKVIIQGGNKLIKEVKVIEKLPDGGEEILMNETRRAKLKTKKL